MMMLGTIIPLLLVFMENALGAIAASAASSVTINLGGVDVELARDAWHDLALGAVKREFSVLMTLVDEVEAILKKRHCGTGPKKGLGDIVKAGGSPGGADAVKRELTNPSHETVEPSFCLGLLWMIRSMSERVGVGVAAVAN